MLKNSYRWIAALSSVFSFDRWESFPRRRGKKIGEGMLRHTVSAMYFLLGQRFTKGNYGCNGGDALCVGSLLTYCQRLRHLRNGSNSVSEITSALAGEFFSTNDLCLLS